ncbi:MAG TPA: cation:proton antiporter [Candidatus Saccharimonadales bacterium]|nr:cation:proton antiporter [Candidatus Saccharimonadales bacterium]
MPQDIFTQLSIVLALAVVISLIMRLLRQPLIIGYILTGVVVGPSIFRLIDAPATFQTFSDLGVALLLFITGLELNARIVKEVGRVTIATGLVQLTCVGALGFAAAHLLGFNTTESLFVAMSLYFSSTIIVVKLLNDRHEQTRLFAKIAIGLLLIEDIIATLALIVVAAGGHQNASWLTTLAQLGLKGGALMLLLILFATKVLPRVSHFLARSQEFLYLFALAWGFGIATLFEKAGFSIEVGALFAGVSLASMPYSREIGARLKPLRDFFLVVFFIALGEGLQISNVKSALLPALALSAIVIIFKPLVIMMSMGFLGYTKKTSFQSAIFLDQISEFSLIFVILGNKSGLVSSHVVTIITLVALFTIITSTYMIKYSESIFNLLEQRLHFFERRLVERREAAISHHVILFGYRKGGHEFIKTFQRMRESFVVVDYDPDVIETLERQKVDYLYGDATDLELLNEMSITKAKMIISTITNQHTNLFLVHHILMLNPHATIICHCDTVEEAVELYERGAAYVMMPHYIGSEKIGTFIRKNGLRKTEFKRYRDKHLAELQNRDD